MVRMMGRGPPGRWRSLVTRMKKASYVIATPGDPPDTALIEALQRLPGTHSVEWGSDPHWSNPECYPVDDLFVVGDNTSLGLALTHLQTPKRRIWGIPSDWRGVHHSVIRLLAIARGIDKPAAKYLLFPPELAADAVTAHPTIPRCWIIKNPDVPIDSTEDGWYKKAEIVYKHHRHLLPAGDEYHRISVKSNEPDRIYVTIDTTDVAALMSGPFHDDPTYCMRPVALY